MKLVFQGFHVQTENEFREHLMNLEMKYKLIQEKHKKELEPLNKEIKEFKAKCKHWKTVYVPDASGNNDWYIECYSCGDYGKHLPRR